MRGLQHDHPEMCRRRNATTEIGLQRNHNAPISSLVLGDQVLVYLPP
jgi:hypothetical protein